MRLRTAFSALLVLGGLGCKEPDRASAMGETGMPDETGTETGEETGTTGPEICEGELGELELAAEGEYVMQGGEEVVALREFCQGGLHATAGASDSTLEVRLTRWEGEGRARVRVEDLLGEAMVEWTELGPDETLEVDLVRSGEVLVRVEPDDAQVDSNEYGLEVTCTAGCDREWTRYPVLFMHGMAGTDTYFGLLDYFFQLEGHLSDPGYLVFFRAADAVNGIEARSEQWHEHIQELVDEGMGRKFNLIAHSQGALDARYLTSILDGEGRVASVVSVSGAHHGTPLADVVTGTFDLFPVSEVMLDLILGTLTGLVGLSGVDLVQQMQDLSTDSVAAFNDEVLDVEGVYYASWAGRTCAVVDVLCAAGNSGETVDPLFANTFDFMTQAEGDNDGIIGVESAKWGEFMGELPADHPDEIGQIADLVNVSFNHKEFYLDELRRLAGLGL